MGRLDRLLLGLFLALALAAGVLGRGIAEHFERGGALRLELGRVQPTALAPATVARFEALRERVMAVYYVSAPERMPVEMRRMGLEVTDLLEALRRRFPERFDFVVVDPAARAELAGYAARRSVAPFKVRSVTRDAWDERTVWSTLVLSAGAGPEAELRGLRPEHLPVLQDLIVAWLDELARPREPRLALAAPEGFQELAEELDLRGALARVDLDGGARVPEADVLLWMRPRAVTGEQLRGLERLLEQGASVIVAGSPWRARELEDPSGQGGHGAVELARAPSAMAELAAHFGLRVEDGLVLDEKGEELEFPAGRERAPHWVRCIAPDQDFHRFAGQPNGTLLFRAPSPLAPEPARLAELGWSAELLATTSDQAWLVPEPPRGPVALAALVPAPGEAVAKQALLVGLVPDDPWRGELVFAAADTPFADGMLRRENVAHGRLLDVLLDQAASSERLVRARVRPALPEVLPQASVTERVSARLFCVGLPAALVLALAAARGVFSGRGATGAGEHASFRRRARRALVPALGAALALAGALGLVRGLAAADVAWDATSGSRNALDPLTRRLAARAGERGELALELLVSPDALLPPRMRAHIRDLEARLDDLERAGARLALRRRPPEDLAEGERTALGLVPHQAASADEEVTRVSRFFAALRLARDDAGGASASPGGRERVVLLDFPDERAFERLEFRLALALLRLDGQSAAGADEGAPFHVPRIAFASDVPRLSAAEAYEQYQQKGLFAPRGADVYALAREALERDGLEVTHVNPRAPVLPPDADVLVWLQPRRSIEPMLEETVRTLVGGGRVLLCAQHFRIETQQFRGGDFELQYWPQPQTPDVDLLYFPELSIELVREVLFDALALPVDGESQLTGRQGGRDFERQSSLLPFQLRVAAANADPDSAVTRRLGDQAFLYANRLRWDERRLAELGLRARTLLTTSERSWSYAWTGGWIPHELLRGPAALEKSSGPDFLGRQPLAVLFEGTFPRPQRPLRLDALPGREAPPPGSNGESSAESNSETSAAPERPWPASAPGRLLFLGCSEFLKNERLSAPEFRGDQLLWNGVAELAFEPELAALATRAEAARGFGFVAPGRRLALRAGAIGAGPAALLLLAGLVALARARRPRPRPNAPRSAAP